jgi:RimJ/RimL family protein N-acetyltransferase
MIAPPPPPPPTQAQSTLLPPEDLEYVLSVPTKDDLGSLAALQTAAFAENRGWFTDHALIERQNYELYRRYYNECPHKLNHCRIIRSPHGDGKTVMAACQLSWKKKQPQPVQPSQSHSHEKKHGNGNDDDNGHVVFIEWIACLPEHMNKGLGSTLIRWATAFARDEMNVKTLTLYCVKSNKDARRLYNRRGFIEQNSSGTGPRIKTKLNKVTNKLSSVLCLGMGSHWTVMTMQKELLAVA